MPITHRNYDSTCFAPLFAVEDRHFWFRARNRVISTIVSQLTANWTSDYQVLEVGCGTGNTLRVLEQSCIQGKVVGMDLFAEGLQYARQRTSCSLVQGDMHAPPFGIPFNLIGLFDVLEHLPDDIQALHDLHALLAPMGVLLLTVPAHPSLWSYFDEIHHYRRYELTDLESKLKRVGYQIEYITQYMASLFPLVWLGRRLAELTDRRPADNPDRTHDLTIRELRIWPIMNDLLAWLLSQEIRLISRRRALPIGTSLLAIARK
jgi:SAM-dependent methyltransferase